MQAVKAGGLAAGSAVLRALIAEAEAPRLRVSECASKPAASMAADAAGQAGREEAACQAACGLPAVEARRHVRGLGLLGSPAAAAARFRRRQPPAATELLYVSDGDGNGVCRHLGTGCGRHSWVNPMLAGHVQARHVMARRY